MAVNQAGWEHRLAAGALMAAAAVLPPAAVFAPLGVAPLGGLVGLATLPLIIRQRCWRRIDWPLAAGPLALFAWALVSALWALDPAQAVKGTLKLATTAGLGACAVAAAMAMTERERRRIGLALVVSLAAMVALLVVEYTFQLAVTRAIVAIKGINHAGYKSHLNRGATVAALLTWPATLLLVNRLRPLPAALLAGLTMAALLLSDSSSTRLAVLAAAATAGLVALAPRWGRRGLAALIVLAALALPPLMMQVPPPQHTLQNWTWVPNSAHHRLTIWSFTAQRIAEHPLRGWGMDASRDMPGAQDEVYLQRLAPDGTVLVTLIESMLPLHPHNAVLQVWLELGVPGMAALVFFVLMVLKRMGELSGRWPQAAAAAVLAGAFCVSVVSYGFWQSWWQTSLWLTTAYLMLAVSRPKACS